MTIEAYPFDNSDVGTELQWQRMMRLLMPDGIDTIPTGGSCRVTAGAGLTVNIAEGHAWLRGYFYRQVGSISRALVVNPATTARIDRIVLRGNLTTNTIEPYVIQGTPATTPTVPAMSYTESLFDLPLADVRVEANDTISSIVDRRRFVGRPIVYCTSQNRPDPQGRPLLAFETDTDRVIFTDGSGTWNLGLGNDAFRPLYAYSGDNGTTTATNWDTTLTDSATPSLSVTFTAPASGRVMIRAGAHLANSTSNGTTYMAMRLRSSAGTDYWPLNDPTVAAPSRMVYFNSPGGDASGGAGASCSAVWYAGTLTPNQSYTALLAYRVGASPTGQKGTWDDRFIEVQPLP